MGVLYRRVHSIRYLELSSKFRTAMVRDPTELDVSATSLGPSPTLRAPSALIDFDGVDTPRVATSNVIDRTLAARSVAALGVQR